MSDKHLPIAVGVLGLAAAWYWSRRNAATLASIRAALPASPSTAGILRGRPAIVVDGNGDTSAPLGNDLVLHVIDPSDPSLYEPGGPLFVGPTDPHAYEPGGQFFTGPIDPSAYDPGGSLFTGPQQTEVIEDWFDAGVG